MKRNIFCSLVLSAMLLAAYELNAAPAKQEKKNLRPQVAVIQKDGKKQLRRCFRDADKNGFCDRGTDQKGKCKNNCRKAEPEMKKSAPAPDKKTAPVPDKTKPQVQHNSSKTNAAAKANSPCACCPLAGNCTNGCLALLSKSKKQALI